MKIIHRFLIICICFCLCILTLTACDTEKSSDIDKKGMKEIISGMVQQQNNQTLMTIYIAPVQHVMISRTQPDRRVLDKLEALCRESLNINLQVEIADAISATTDVTRQMGPNLLDKIDATHISQEVYAITAFKIYQ